jgi:hypothetical protein
MPNHLCLIYELSHPFPSDTNRTSRFASELVPLVVFVKVFERVVCAREAILAPTQAPGTRAGIVLLVMNREPMPHCVVPAVEETGISVLVETLLVPALRFLASEYTNEVIQCRALVHMTVNFF